MTYTRFGVVTFLPSVSSRLFALKEFRPVANDLSLDHVDHVFGSAVTAEAMTFCPLRLITDVRIRDDLAKHESYFMSEVRRLRRIVTDEDFTTPLFCLIDEPFRGTNSPERTAAGVALLEHLLASEHLVLLATHEEQLAQTALRSDAAQNHRFQETLTDTGITFEFDLRPGPASTRTAIRILEQEHYPPALVKRARDLMQEKG